MKLTALFIATATAGEYENFDHYVSKYGKNYESDSHYQKAKNAWAESIAEIAAHNAGDHSWSQALNENSDLSWEEFRSVVLMEPQDCSATTPGKFHPSNAGNDDASLGADSHDWSEIINGGNWPVKSQGHCGSCWTFSTAGTLEAHHFLHYNTSLSGFVNISEQQLVDCAGAFNNNGCSGGLPSQAFEYIKYNGGIDNETQYPYLGKNGTSCAYVQPPAAKVLSVVNVTYLDEDSILKALNTKAEYGGGPVSIAYQVSKDFRNYHDGVYDGECSSSKTDVNHAVVAVGFGTMNSTTPATGACFKYPVKAGDNCFALETYYGTKNITTPTHAGCTGEIIPGEILEICGCTENCKITPIPAKDYFKVRNSWGTSFGIDGYFMIKRGENKCGLADCASYPKVF